MLETLEEKEKEITELRATNLDNLSHEGKAKEVEDEVEL